MCVTKITMYASMYSTTFIVYSMFDVHRNEDTSDDKGGLFLKCSIFDCCHPTLRLLVRIRH